MQSGPQTRTGISEFPAVLVVKYCEEFPFSHDISSMDVWDLHAYIYLRLPLKNNHSWIGK